MKHALIGMALGVFIAFVGYELGWPDLGIFVGAFVGISYWGKQELEI